MRCRTSCRRSPRRWARRNTRRPRARWRTRATCRPCGTRSARGDADSFVVAGAEDVGDPADLLAVDHLDHFDLVLVRVFWFVAEGERHARGGGLAAFHRDAADRG